MNRAQMNELLSPDYWIHEILGVRRLIEKNIKNVPGAFDPYFFETSRGLKQLVTVDMLAEKFLISVINGRFGQENIRVEGEEQLQQELDLRGEHRICVLLDTIDGTDLLERRFGNWCTAAIIFDPQKSEILGAFIALPPEHLSSVGWLYYATNKERGAFKKELRERGRKSNPSIPLTKLAVTKELRDASMCMYAQKSMNLLELLNLTMHPRLVEWLNKNLEIDSIRKKERRPELKFRFYNLAGNPMMARMPEGTVDVVFDLLGQAPHDVVPGAYIALQSGAVIGTPDGAGISFDGLAETLAQPGNSPIKYVIAANEKLFSDFARLL